MRKTAKKKYICIDGPLKGVELYLTGPSTAFFTIGGASGRYKGSGYSQIIMWESLNA